MRLEDTEHMDNMNLLMRTNVSKRLALEEKYIMDIITNRNAYLIGLELENWRTQSSLEKKEFQKETLISIIKRRMCL